MGLKSFVCDLGGVFEKAKKASLEDAIRMFADPYEFSRVRREAQLDRRAALPRFM